MDRVEYYSGESAGSPEFLIDPTDTSGQFAVNAKELYSYDSQNRQPYAPYGIPQQQNVPIGYNYTYMNPPNQMYSQPINFGAQGYNQMYPQQPFMGAPMNTPTMYPNQQGYQMGIQTMNPSMINVGNVGNPAFGMLNQWQQRNPYQQGYYNPYTQQVFRPVVQQVHDQVVEVPGYNPTGGVGLLPSNIHEVCEQMDVDMMLEQEAAIAKRQKRAQGYYNNNMFGYMNYYGMPFVSNGYDSSITNKYMEKLQEIKQQAIESKKEFNKNLSRLCHNYLNDGVTEADINRIYDGYSYTIPANSIQEYQNQERLYNMVPFNNASMYQQHSAQVSYLYHMVAPAGRNMNEFFQDAGMFFTIDMLEKEYHRRRNLNNYMDRDIVHEYLRKYALDHDIEFTEKKHTRQQAEELADLALEKGGNLTKGDIINVLYTPEKIAELKEQGFIINPDGSTEIRPPDWILNGTGKPTAQVIEAENEIDYEMRRSAFIASIYEGKRSRTGG